jgi:RNase P subunit RPR2
MSSEEYSVTVTCSQCRTIFIVRYSPDCFDLEAEEVLDDFITATCPKCGAKMCVDI